MVETRRQKKHNAIFERNQAESPLLNRLPREIRDMIYQFALDTAIVELPQPPSRFLTHVWNTPRTRIYAEPRFFFQEPGLLSTCRQIKQEAKSYADKYTTVVIAPTFDYDLHCFEKTLRAMHTRASRFQGVQEIVFERHELSGILNFSGRQYPQNGPNHFGITSRTFPLLEAVLWPNCPLRRVTWNELMATARYCFMKPNLLMYNLPGYEEYEKPDEPDESSRQKKRDDRGWVYLRPRG
ncbi:hypothetical protein E8E13_009236 [Curvularia kusanoi]|uniref:2EXR domain-containing protein n=1 Tax=Curvularia kusanoi TaxID=90978 RepID=A0A9P4TLV8_CURKU|nr:hypothetical protein E8E13_009236 [Curvularia kusanoi]